MTTRVMRWLMALAVVVVAFSGAVHAQGALLDEVHTLSGGAEPVEHPLNVTEAGTYQLAVTDIKVPAALTSVKLAVTRGATVVATASTTPTTASSTLSFDATPGAYVIRVVGRPGTAGTGSVGVKVTKAGQAASFDEFVSVISVPSPPQPENRAVIEDTFTPTVSGNYEVVLADAALPEALPDIVLSVTEQGGPLLAALLSAGSATFAAQAGVQYKVAVIAESQISVNAGLFTVRVRQAATTTNVYSRTVTVGRVSQLDTVALSAGPHVLSLNDLQFPAPLVEKGAALVFDANVLATSAGTDAPFTVSAGGQHSIYVVAKAAAASSGTYGLEVKTAAGAALYSTVQTVQDVVGGASPGHEFVVDIATAGAYRVRLADFAFPAGFGAITLGAAQVGSPLLGQLSAAGSLDLANVAVGKLFLTVIAQSTSPNGGVFGLDVTPAAGGAPVYETTQGVGNLFQGRKVTVTSAGAYRVTLTDLGFPATFHDLGAVVTRGADAVGTVLNSAQFDFNATAGSYFVTFIATPDATENAGTYGITLGAKPPVPTVTLSASATQVTVGSTADLTWSTTNANSCVASNGWAGTKATSGTEKTSALNAAATFKLECTGDGGSASTTVTVSTVAAQSKKGGGGSLDWLTLAGLALFIGLRVAQPKAGMRRARRSILA